MQRSVRSTCATPASVSASSAARQRSSLPSRTMSSSEARAERLGDVVAHLVAARPDRGPIAAASRPPPRAATPASTTPASRPFHPACRTATAGAAPLVRASASGRQSALIASTGKVRLVRPEPVAAVAARTGTSAVHGCGVHLVVEREELRVRADLRRTRGGGSRPRARRRRRSCGRGSSDAYGPSLTPPTRVVNTTSYGPGACQRITRRSAPSRARAATRACCAAGRERRRRATRSTPRRAVALAGSRAPGGRRRRRRDP